MDITTHVIRLAPGCSPCPHFPPLLQRPLPLFLLMSLSPSLLVSAHLQDFPNISLFPLRGRSQFFIIYVSFSHRLRFCFQPSWMPISHHLCFSRLPLCLFHPVSVSRSHCLWSGNVFVAHSLCVSVCICLLQDPGTVEGGRDQYLPVPRM